MFDRILLMINNQPLLQLGGHTAATPLTLAMTLAGWLAARHEWQQGETSRAQQVSTITTLLCAVSVLTSSGAALPALLSGLLTLSVIASASVGVQEGKVQGNQQGDRPSGRSQPEAEKVE